MSPIVIAVALSNALAATAAPTTSIQVQIQPDKSAKILQIVLSIAVVVLSATTFLLGYRKRIQERRPNWYIKIVVDESLPRLFEFFKKAEQDLSSAAAKCEKQAPSDVSSELTAAIADFSAHLIEVKNFITEKLIVFDEKSTAVLVDRLFKLQDDISECFEDYAVKKRRNREDIQNILLACQREILKLLYECEFKNF